MITLSTTLFDQLKNYAQTDYPNECCGGLLGKIDVYSQKMVQLVIPIQNQWEDTPDEQKNRRFKISSDDYQNLEARAKQSGLQLLGIYHSHPDHPAIPSKTDLAFAFPFFSYPILSIKDGVFDYIKSYELDLDSGKFKEEPVKLIH